MRVVLKTGSVDLNTHEVTLGERSARLSPNEARLLRYLVERPGQTIAQSELLREVFGYAEQVRSRTVITTMQRLRGKIELDPAEPVHLHTVYGVGYRFEPLQAPATLLGRESELQQIRERLALGPLWLLAPGGYGKSTLAKALAAEHGEAALWVSLEQAEGPDGLRAALALALGLEQVQELVGLELALAHRARFFVFDAAEGVAPELAECLEAWGLKGPVLVTSRVPAPGRQAMNLGPLGREAAQALFARRAPPHLELTPLAPLLERLQGIPLALELAAARLSVFSVEELGETLTDLRAILAGGQGRHASMAGVLAWSWQRTPQGMRDVVSGLSVARGGLRLEHAASLVEEDGLGVLQACMRWGWVERAGGRVRVLDPVRDYIAQVADLDAAERRHLRLFLAQARSRREGLLGGSEGSFLQEEWGNLQAAFLAGLARKDPMAAELVFLLAVPMIRRVPTPQALEAFDAAVALAQGEVLAELLLERANLWMGRDSLAAAERDLDRAAALGFADPGQLAYRRGKLFKNLEQYGRAIGELERAIPALHGTRALNAQTELGVCLIRSGRGEEAPPILLEALARARLKGLPGPAFLALGALASLYTEQARHEDAEGSYREALSVCEGIGDRANAAPLHNNLGNLFYYTGRARQAETEWSKTLELSAALGSRRGVALAETNLAQLAILEGQGTLARARLERARAGFQAVGAASGLAFVDLSLGRLLLREGRHAQAERCFERAEPALPASLQWWLAVERVLSWTAQGQLGAAEEVLAKVTSGGDASAQAALGLAQAMLAVAKLQGGDPPPPLRAQVAQAIAQAHGVQEPPILELAAQLQARVDGGA